MPRFYIGQPVICVDDRLRRSVLRRYPGMTWPRAGVQYTIRGIIENDRLTFVTLKEIRNRRDRYPNGVTAELGFWEERFEPATDISDLKRAEKSHEIFTKDPNKDWDRSTRRRVRKKEDA